MAARHADTCCCSTTSPLAEETLLHSMGSLFPTPSQPPKCMQDIVAAMQALARPGAATAALNLYRCAATCRACCPSAESAAGCACRQAGTVPARCSGGQCAADRALAGARHFLALGHQAESAADLHLGLALVGSAHPPDAHWVTDGAESLNNTRPAMLHVLPAACAGIWWSSDRLPQ